MDNQPEKQRRQRAVLSCNDCRRRKLQCDRELPCKRCIKGGIAELCAYSLEAQAPKLGGDGRSPRKRQREVSPEPTNPRTQVNRQACKRSSSPPNPLEIKQSDLALEEQIKQLRREVSRLQQKLVDQASSSEDCFSTSIVSATHGLQPQKCASLMGLLKGRSYATFFHGPSCPMSILVQVSNRAVLLARIYQQIHTALWRFGADCSSSQIYVTS